MAQEDAPQSQPENQPPGTIYIPPGTYNLKFIDCTWELPAQKQKVEIGADKREAA
jgi:hypothetical protein